jgi:hypothetical protein
MPGPATQKSPGLSDYVIGTEKRAEVFSPEQASLFVMVVFREQKSDPEAGIDEPQP